MHTCPYYFGHTRSITTCARKFSHKIPHSWQNLIDSMSIGLLEFGVSILVPYCQFILLERNTLLKNSNLVIAILFTVGPLSTCHVKYEFTKTTANLFHGVTADESTRVEVNPLTLTVIQRCVSGNLDRRHKRCERCSTARREEHEMTTGSPKSGAGHKVIARSGKQVESRGRETTTIRQHCLDRGAARLLCTA